VEGLNRDFGAGGLNRDQGVGGLNRDRDVGGTYIYIYIIHTHTCTRTHTHTPIYMYIYSIDTHVWARTDPTYMDIYMDILFYISGHPFTRCCRQIPARCPLFSSLDRANDYAHSPIVAPLSPPRLTRALRTHTNAQSALSHPGMSMVRSPLPLLSFTLFRPM